MPNGANRKKPAWRSSRLPKTLGASKRGYAEPVDRPVGCDERTRVAVGEEPVVGDRRERRRRGSALRFAFRIRRRGAHDSTHGSCQPPGSATSVSAAACSTDAKCGVPRGATMPTKNNPKETEPLTSITLATRPSQGIGAAAQPDYGKLRTPGASTGPQPRRPLWVWLRPQHGDRRRTAWRAADTRTD